MPKTVKTEDFINRAKIVHGERYDYSRVAYVNMHTKVCIVCPLHGEFYQLPQPHLKGQGCPICGREKQKQTLIDKYGVDNPMKVESIQQKARTTCLEKYGHTCCLLNDDVRAKSVATMVETYGTNVPLRNSWLKDKVRSTVRKRYGVDNPSQSEDVRDKIRSTCLERYGTSEFLASDIARDKIKATNQIRYGGNAPMCSHVVREKSEVSCLKRYGVCHASQVKEIQDKIFATKKLHGTISKSSPEDLLYSKLCDEFGSDDVERNYRSDVYPFACDFHIKSRDLYMELNGFWTHGPRWFDETLDGSVIELWVQRESQKHTGMYANAVHTWSVSDVEKRNVARRNRLNYVVFWDNMLRDFELWLSLGCPDGTDWDREYSWIPMTGV